MIEALQSRNLDLPHITHESILPHLTTGFPWHEPEKGHTHLNNAEHWWGHIRSIYTDIYMKLGLSEGLAQELALEAQHRYVDLTKWELYDDTIEVLQQLREAGWKHLIVSNHVPELAIIVEHLGLKPLIEHIVNSAEVGYEKPNPNIYEAALEYTKPDSEVWMVGDNIMADVLGAESVGLQAILVRHQDERATYQYDDLYGVMNLLLQTDRA